MFTELLRDYLENKRENTRRRVMCSWKLWNEYTDVDKATERQALGFISGLKRRGDLADNTIKARFDDLHALYGFFVDMRAVEFNIFAPVKRAISWRQRIQVRPTKLIPLSTVKFCIKTPRAGENEQRNTRDAAILCTLFGCGLRRSELVALNVGDVRLSPSESGHILELARTKSGKRQTQPIPLWAWSAISKLITQRNSEGARNADPLFCNYWYKETPLERISDATLYRMYKSYADAAPHSARATFATQLARQGKSQLEISKALRHSTAQASEVYIKLAEDEIENVARDLDYNEAA